MTKQWQKVNIGLGPSLAELGKRREGGSSVAGLPRNPTQSLTSRGSRYIYASAGQKVGKNRESKNPTNSPGNSLSVNKDARMQVRLRQVANSDLISLLIQGPPAARQGRTGHCAGLARQEPLPGKTFLLERSTEAQQACGSLMSKNSFPCQHPRLTDLSQWLQVPGSGLPAGEQMKSHRTDLERWGGEKDSKWTVEWCSRDRRQRRGHLKVVALGHYPSIC
jgi:hypothetical protein